MSDYLPPEVWVEILQRLNPQSLVKCTSVCKSWKSLITNPDFISDHLARALQHKHGNNGSLFLHLGRRNVGRGNDHFVFDEFYSVYSDNGLIGHLSISKFHLTHLFLGKHWRLVGTCDGLVCLVDYKTIYGTTLIIWNPSIRKYVVLPKPRVIRYSFEGQPAFYGFGFDSRNHDFKLVRLAFFQGEQYTPVVLVYYLATNCWRSITSRVPPRLLPSYVGKTSQMLVNGVLHWVVKGRSDGGRSYNFILTFDFAGETFGELMLPQSVKESRFQLFILAGGDSLAVALRKESAVSDGKVFSIWVMKEYGVAGSWSEVFHVDSRKFGGVSRLLALRSSGEVVLQSRSNGIIILDPMRKLVKHLGPGGSSGFFHAFVGYHVESLYLINKENHVLSY